MHKFCIAPMMDWTDRHCRYFHRRLSRRALLYTEMVTADAVLFGDRTHLIGFDAAEHPLVLQLGGSDPGKLAEAARIAADMGYDEINLNVGCPSDRVQSGRFGACLMAEPGLVAACVRAMADAVAIPVHVKCRIGIDNQDSERDLDRFVDTVAHEGGCRLFVVHARKAWLKGLSPKQNRDVPPLNYSRVYRLKAARPDFTIILNGGVETLEAAQSHLAHVDGVMMGRTAYQTPALLTQVDGRLFGERDDPIDRESVLEAMAGYIDRHIAAGGRFNDVARHMLGLFHGEPGARAYRRHLAENGPLPGASGALLLEALAAKRRAAPRPRLAAAG